MVHHNFTLLPIGLAAGFYLGLQLAHSLKRNYKWRKFLMDNPRTFTEEQTREAGFAALNLRTRAVEVRAWTNAEAREMRMVVNAQAPMWSDYLEAERRFNEVMERLIPNPEL